MRVYKLEIRDPKQLNRVLATFKQDGGLNPITASIVGLEIDFDLQTYDNDVNGVYVIQIHNVDYFFMNMNSQEYLLGKAITLYGGLAKSPITDKQGINAPNEFEIFTTPLYEGYIANAIPTMDGVGNVLRLLVIPTPMFKDTAKKEKIELSIKNGMPVASLFIPIIKQITGFKTVFSPQSLTVKSKGSTMLSIESIKDVENYFIKTLDLKFSIENKTVYIGDVIKLKSHIISPYDLLGQPEMLNIATISITVPLNAKYKMNDNIMIPPNLYTGLQNLSNSIATLNDSGFSNLLGGNNNLKTMFAGLYKIIGVWHKGSNRNSDPEAWSTTIKAVNPLLEKKLRG